jgi:arylsulfatase
LALAEARNPRRVCSQVDFWRFDEFFGSLYHLNAEQEPENPDYFKDPEMRKRFGTRGVRHCWANPDGTQKIESTGPLNIERMKTIDDEVTKASLEYLEKAKKADKPFFSGGNLPACAYSRT